MPAREIAIAEVVEEESPSTRPTRFCDPGDLADRNHTQSFRSIAASGIGRQLLRAIRQLEHGPNAVDLETFPGRSRTWFMYSPEAPASEWRIPFWLDPVLRATSHLPRVAWKSTLTVHLVRK